MPTDTDSSIKDLKESLFIQISDPIVLPSTILPIDTVLPTIDNMTSSKGVGDNERTKIETLTITVTFDKDIELVIPIYQHLILTVVPPLRRTRIQPFQLRQRDFVYTVFEGHIDESALTASWNEGALHQFQKLEQSEVIQPDATPYGN